MKSTYKLLGTFWDHKCPMAYPPPLLSYDELFLDASHPDCLLDLLSKNRSVSHLKLLAINSEADFKNYIGPLRNCNKIALVLDYDFQASNPTHLQFIAKRTAQICQQLNEALSQAELVLMLSQQTA
jgi:hypothetical protein